MDIPHCMFSSSPSKHYILKSKFFPLQMSWETVSWCSMPHTRSTHRALSHNHRQCHNITFSPSTCSSRLPTESFRQLSTWPATVRTEATEEECFHLAIDSFPFYREYENLYSLLYAWQKEGRAVTGTHRNISIRELSHPRTAVSWGNYTRLRKKKGRGQRKELHQNLKWEQMGEKTPYLVKGDQEAQGRLSLELRPAKNYTGGERKRIKLYYCHCTDLQWNLADLPNEKTEALYHLLTLKNTRVIP